MKELIVQSLVISIVSTTSALFVNTNSTQAATVKFTNSALFEASTTNVTTINFEGLTPPNQTSGFSNGASFDNVEFFSSSNILGAFDAGYSTPSYDWNSGAVLYVGGKATINLPSGVNAVGSDIMSDSIDPKSNPPYANSFTITLSNGQIFQQNSLQQPDRQFIGFTTDLAITSISFQPKVGNTILDNFRFGTALPITPVPEPFTIIGTLIGGAAVLRMRKKLNFADKI